jgi:hypothetical protein
MKIKIPLANKRQVSGNMEGGKTNESQMFICSILIFRDKNAKCLPNPGSK